jgi:energy-coupling factor transporter ATP-binding protein EcfA2
LIVGPNGSGKSTVFNALDAIARPTEYQYETLVSAVGSEPVEVMAFSKTGANMGVQWSRRISSSTLFREDPGLKGASSAVERFHLIRLRSLRRSHCSPMFS